MRVSFFSNCDKELRTRLTRYRLDKSMKLASSREQIREDVVWICSSIVLNIESATCSIFVNEMMTSRSASWFHCVALITICESERIGKQGIEGADCIVRFGELMTTWRNSSTRNDMSYLGDATIAPWRQLSHCRITSVVLKDVSDHHINEQGYSWWIIEQILYF